MKKIVALILVVVMMYTLSIPAFADPGVFVESPGNAGAPALISFFNEDEECFAELTVTPYKDRDQLDQETQNDIVEAYEDIIGTNDLSTLVASLAQAATALGINVTDLAVSDLFDISYESCEHHDEHGAFTIQLKANTFERFVGLMHYTNDKWELVDNATVDENNVMTFKVDNLSPFAVVVNTKQATTPTGDSNALVYVLLLVASVTGIAVVGYKTRKVR